MAKLREWASMGWDTVRFLAWLYRGYETEDQLRAEISRIRVKHGREPLRS